MGFLLTPSEEVQRIIAVIIGVRQHASTANMNMEIEMCCSSGHYQQVL